MNLVPITHFKQNYSYSSSTKSLISKSSTVKSLDLALTRHDRNFSNFTSRVIVVSKAITSAQFDNPNFRSESTKRAHLLKINPS